MRTFALFALIAIAPGFGAQITLLGEPGYWRYFALLSVITLVFAVVAWRNSRHIQLHR